MPITPLPTPPSRSDTSEVFIERGDALLAALPQFVEEANALAQAGDFNATVWVSGTTYAIGDRRYSPIDFATYRRKTNGAGTTDPSLDTTNWAPLVAVVEAFTTGDVKITLKTAADSGWVMMNDGTIGSASSGATTRANADTEDLFTLLWNNTVDAQCAVSTGRGASAAADFAANKTIALPKALGRALAAAGAGSGLTSRALALITGVETHALSTAELATHSHANTATTTATVDGASQAGTIGKSPTVQRTGAAAGSVTMTNANAGSGTAHQNMQPTLFLNVMVKL